MTRIKLPLTIALAAVLVTLVAGFTAHESRTNAVAPATSAAALQNTFRTVFKKVSPSVVQIQTADGLGSGIVLDRNGNIVTNFHVVDSESTSYRVLTSSGKRLDATLVGVFPQNDLAVIRVASGSSLKPATFAQSSKLQVGDIAIAIGNPLGLSSSVTQGIVSALGRQAPEGNGYTLQNAIQTSAPINPGNSGGALVDIQGRVIGIPTLGASSSQFGGVAAGIGFAIPSDTVRDIAGQLVQHGKVVNTHRAYLGVTIGDATNGVYINTVANGGPAGRAGIAAGDVVVAVNGKATLSSDDLGSVLAALKPGEKVPVRVVHQDGSAATVTVTLGELPGA
jgi:S1-C subfamily serine protease